MPRATAHPHDIVSHPSTFCQGSLHLIDFVFEMLSPNNETVPLSRKQQQSYRNRREIKLKFVDDQKYRSWLEYHCRKFPTITPKYYIFDDELNFVGNLRKLQKRIFGFDLKWKEQKIFPLTTLHFPFVSRNVWNTLFHWGWKAGRAKLSDCQRSREKYDGIDIYQRIFGQFATRSFLIPTKSGGDFYCLTVSRTSRVQYSFCKSKSSASSNFNAETTDDQSI